MLVAKIKMDSCVHVREDVVVVRAFISDITAALLEKKVNKETRSFVSRFSAEQLHLVKQ